MSGLIPQPFIDEILARTDILELIEHYVPLKKQGSVYIACCPFHNEKTPSFNVITRKQFYHCFGCGANGNAISFLMDYLKLNFVETIQHLANHLGLEIPSQKSAKNISNNNKLCDLLTNVNEFYQQQLKVKDNPAVNYLKKRGVNGKIAKLYQLGYAPIGWQTLTETFKNELKNLVTTGMVIKTDQSIYDRYRQRLMFPIHNRRGNIIGFGGRAIDANQKPKYLNSPETPIFQKSHELYGLYQLIDTHQPIDFIVIVEGYLDVIALAQFGIKNVVATLGTSTSVHHLKLLQRFTNKIYFCFDGDNAGRLAAWKALETCLGFINQDLDVYFIFLPEDNDPDSLVRSQGPEAFVEFIKKASSLNQFFMETLKNKFNLKTLAGKTQLINVAKEYLLKMQAGVYKELLIEELSLLVHLEPHRIKNLIETPLTDISKMPALKRTPIRIAIALLIQHPEIYPACKDKVDLNFLQKHHHLLYKIIEKISNTQNITSAVLLESWRDTQFFKPLSKLAFWDHQVPEQELKKEFLDIINFLQRQDLEKKVDNLLEKSRKQGLTSNEKLLLQKMLKNKHNSITHKIDV